jgi:hypothetical protein
MSDGISQPSSVPPGAAPLSQDQGLSRPMQGRMLLLAHLGWWIITGLVVLMTLLAIPLNLASLRAVCTQDNCSGQQLTSTEIQGLPTLNLPVDDYIVYAVTVNLLPPVVYLAVALILFLRKPNDGMAYFTSLTLVLFGGVTYPDFVQQLAVSSPGWTIPYLVMQYLGSLFLVTFFYTFPTRKFVPDWMRFLLLFWVIEQVFDAVSGPPLNLRLAPEWLANGGFMLILVSSLYAQIHRYRRVSSSIQRQQTKWVVFGIVIALSTLLLSALIVFSGFLQPSHILTGLILNTLITLAITFIPISIGIAILRSRLYDIDLLINRTLVYGAVTAILAGIFAASSSLIEKVLLAVTGQQSDVATVLSTLLVVACFEPLKARVARFVDARFKYPNRAFGAFGEKLREFVELSDPTALLSRFLREALDSFDAQSGAVYLGSGAQLELVQQIGAQGVVPDADAELSVPLTHGSKQFGLIALGARKNGEAYSEEDRRSLEQMGQLVARTIQLSNHANHRI